MSDYQSQAQEEMWDAVAAQDAERDADHAAGRNDALEGKRDEDRYERSLAYRDGWKSGEQERWLAQDAKEGT